MSGKRKDYITWDEYFMAVARLADCGPRIPTVRWGPVSSVRIIKYCRWVITVSL